MSKLSLAKFMDEFRVMIGSSINWTSLNRFNPIVVPDILFIFKEVSLEN